MFIKNIMKRYRRIFLLCRSYNHNYYDVEIVMSSNKLDIHRTSLFLWGTVIYCTYLKY